MECSAKGKRVLWETRVWQGPLVKKLNLIFIIFLNVYVCVYVGATVSMWLSEDNLQELTTSFRQVGLRHQTQVNGLVSSTFAYWVIALVPILCCVLYDGSMWVQKPEHIVQVKGKVLWVINCGVSITSHPCHSIFNSKQSELHWKRTM